MTIMMLMFVSLGSVAFATPPCEIGGAESCAVSGSELEKVGGPQLLQKKATAAVATWDVSRFGFETAIRHSVDSSVAPNIVFTHLLKAGGTSIWSMLGSILSGAQLLQATTDAKIPGSATLRYNNNRSDTATLRCKRCMQQHRHSTFFGFDLPALADWFPEIMQDITPRAS